MFNHRSFVTGVALSLVMVAASASCAMAQKWGPEGATAVIASTEPSIEIGSKVFTCGEIAGEGKIEHSAKWTFTPTFTECTASIKAGGAWTAVADSNEEATLTIPSGEANRVAIEVSSKCTVFMESGGTLNASKDFYNGTNGTTEPSVLVFAEPGVAQTVPVVDSPKGCLNSATKAAISANFELLNMTSGSEAITDEGEFSDNFESSNSKGESRGKSTEAAMKIVLEAGGGTIECVGAKEGKEGVAEAIYKIRKAEKGQGEVTHGGHQVITVESWGKCTAKSGTIKGVAAKVSKCELGIAGEREKAPTGGKGLGSILTECTAEAEGCVLKVGAQEGLKMVNYENSSKALIEKPVVAGLTDTAGSLCELVGVKKTTEGKLTGEFTDPETNTV
jgi:hypothetical protein